MQTTWLYLLNVTLRMFTQATTKYHKTCIRTNFTVLALSYDYWKHMCQRGLMLIGKDSDQNDYLILQQLTLSGATCEDCELAADIW